MAGSALNDERLTVSLGDLGRIVTGKTPSTRIPDHFGGEVPFVTPSDMDGRKIIGETERYLTERGVDSVAGAKIPARAVMVSCIGSDMGKAAIAGRACVTNQQINSIIVNDHWNPEYVYYNLSTRQDELKHVGAGGSAVPILNKGHFSQVGIELPPLPVQEAIAYILGTLDDKIELNRRLNETLEAMARAIFKSWFVDFDPVRAKMDGRKPEGMDLPTAKLFPDGFANTMLGKTPNGWHCGRWGEVVTLEYGKGIRDYRDADGSYRVFGTNGPVGWHDEPLCQNAGIIIGRKGAYRGVHYSPRPFYVIDTAFYLCPKTDLDVKWAYYELLNLDINSMDSGSAIPSTSREDFYGIPVCIPPQELQRRFGEVVETLFCKKYANELESETLAMLRDTLLPKLLSGEIRVKDADELDEFAI